MAKSDEAEAAYYLPSFGKDGCRDTSVITMETPKAAPLEVKVA